MIELKNHQVDACNAVVDEIELSPEQCAGRVVVPTGGGKTFIEAAILQAQMTDHAVNKIHLVLSPRIMLSNQLLNEYRVYTDGTSGLKYREVAFHSGDEPDADKTVRGKGVKKVNSTTDITDIRNEIMSAKFYNQHLVIFSTYHSCGKLADAGVEFDTVIADESQYCVATIFNSSIKNLKSRVKLFFTATEKHTASKSGRGLNNEGVYGKLLYFITPKELINLGLIVPPRLHVLYGEVEGDDSNAVLYKVIEISKEQHQLTQPELGFSKILFAMDGTGDVDIVTQNLKKIKQELPDHDVFTIISNKKHGARINGVEVSRKTFMKELKVAERNCIICHYDILSEGIDVDGITGVAILRNMGLAKMLQTIGRAVRVYKPDPTLKKQAWISVPVINNNDDDKELVSMYVRAIRRAGYEITYEDVVVSGWELSRQRHAKQQDTVDDNYDTKHKTMFGSLFIEEIFHKIEEQEFYDDLAEAAALKAAEDQVVWDEISKADDDTAINLLLQHATKDEYKSTFDLLFDREKDFWEELSDASDDDAIDMLLRK
jgi:superfamily II DNA or RNA helicase